MCALTSGNKATSAPYSWVTNCRGHFAMLSVMLSWSWESCQTLSVWACCAKQPKNREKRLKVRSPAHGYLLLVLYIMYSVPICHQTAREWHYITSSNQSIQCTSTTHMITMIFHLLDQMFCFYKSSWTLHFCVGHVYGYHGPTTQSEIHTPNLFV